jgi:hypothetical protein
MIKSIALLVSLAASRVAAQDLPPLPSDTARLIDEARSLPPEFSADILLRLADSRIIEDRAWKRQLIEEAFKVGVRASLPYRKTGEATTDSRASAGVLGQRTGGSDTTDASRSGHPFARFPAGTDHVRRNP